MNHEDGVLLSALADGELTGAEAARVEAHLLGCAPCRAELQSLRAMKSLLAAAPRRAMPPELVAAIESRLGRRATPWALLQRFAAVPRYWAPTAALAAAAVAMTLWVHVLDRAPDQYVPLEPLLAAHSRYQAESLVPEDNLVAASYSSLSSADASSGDQDSD